MMKKLLFTLLTLVGLFANAQQSYYNDVNLSLTGTALRDALATKITNTHTNTLSYTPGIWEACKATDVNPNNSSEITLLYGWENGSDGDFTNDLYRDITLQDTGSAGAYWNREHTYAKSLGTPDLGTTGPGADAHHLRAADKNRNSARGSLKFVDGSGNSGSVSGGWYPGDQWKGDVARMMMYMYLRYGSQCLPTNVGVGTANTVDSNMIDLFLEWNAADPVSDVEDARNDYHENTSNTYAQGNRNPFIDNPNLATQIWGGPVAQNRWGSSDTEAPTIPTNVNTSSITSNSVTVTWTASTDNVAVTSYEVFVDGVSNKTTSTTSTDITGLNPSTTYTFTVRALDAAGNPSNQSAGAMATTLSGGGASGTCASETFDNIPAVNSSYTTRTWTGDDGFSWEATDARTDQTLNGKAITVRNGVITSAQVANGIGSFTVKTKRVFTGSNGTFDLNVNGNKVGDIAYSDVEQTITINNINITGNVIITINNNSGTGNRVVFDDLSWECYSATAGIEDTLLSNVSVYPNPSTNKRVSIKVPNELELKNISIYSVIGKEVYREINPKSSNGIYQVEFKNSGIYLLKIASESANITKKIIIQ